VAIGDRVPGFKNLPQRYSPHEIAPRTLDRFNLLAKDVKANREFFPKAARASRYSRSFSMTGPKWAAGWRQPSNPMTLRLLWTGVVQRAGSIILPISWTAAKMS
jgi:hypothetical protein